MNSPVVSVSVYNNQTFVGGHLDQPILLEFKLLETANRSKPLCVQWNHSSPWVHITPFQIVLLTLHIRTGQEKLEVWLMILFVTGITHNTSAMAQLQWMQSLLTWLFTPIIAVRLSAGRTLLREINVKHNVKWCIRKYILHTYIHVLLTRASYIHRHAQVYDHWKKNTWPKQMNSHKQHI